jgi:formylmethanofuran dehydrogenase subunit E
MALYAAQLLDIELPRADKRLLVIAETDGCAVDGVIAATGCHVGGRTLRILDVGKVAATFTDVSTGTSFRIIPSPRSRSLAIEKMTEARNRWDAMLHGYQELPYEELFVVQKVELDRSLEEIISSAGREAICDVCGEEVINGREVHKDGAVLCSTCAGNGYYHVCESSHMSYSSSLSENS